MAETTSPSHVVTVATVPTEDGRLVFIDVMKVIAIALVIAHHAGQAYGPGAADWIVDDAAMAVWLKAFFQVNAAFGMGLMFLDKGGFTMASLLYCAWEAVICVGLCLGLMVTGQAVVRRTNRFLMALSGAAYAAYMLHLIIVVAIQAAILDVEASAVTKFLFVAALGIALSFGLAHGARWVPGLRDLLGVAVGRGSGRNFAPDSGRTIETR